MQQNFEKKCSHTCTCIGLLYSMSICSGLKTVDTIGNCQRLVFTVCVPQHMHNITNLWKFELNGSSKLRDNNEKKNTLVTRICVLSDA